MSIRNKIRMFILTNFMIPASQADFSDTDSLLKKGIIDSMGVMELLSFVQKNYAFKPDPKEIVPENFDTLKNLEDYILRKTGKNA